MIVTPQYIIYKLRTDPNFLAEAIVYNNPQAVKTKLSNHADFDAEMTDEQLADYVKGLIAEKQLDVVNDILQVPFDENNAEMPLNEAYAQMSMERGRTMAGKFLDTSGGLFLLALEPHELENPTVKNINPTLGKVKSGCGCSNCNTCKIKAFYGKHKKLIIAGIILLAVIYIATKKSNK